MGNKCRRSGGFTPLRPDMPWQTQRQRNETGNRNRYRVTRGVERTGGERHHHTAQPAKKLARTTSCSGAKMDVTCTAAYSAWRLSWLELKFDSKLFREKQKYWWIEFIPDVITFELIFLDDMGVRRCASSLVRARIHSDVFLDHCCKRFLMGTPHQRRQKSAENLELYAGLRGDAVCMFAAAVVSGIREARTGMEYGPGEWAPDICGEFTVVTVCAQSLSDRYGSRYAVCLLQGHRYRDQRVRVEGAAALLPGRRNPKLQCCVVA